MQIDKKRLNQLDGLKGISCILVFLIHYYVVSGHSIPIKAFKELFLYGWIGVEFFFTLSGFFIAYSYRDRIQKFSFVNFLKKRIGKFYISVLCIILLDIILIFLDNYFTNGLIYENRSINFYSFLLASTLTQSGWIENEVMYASITWYLNILIICYILYYYIAYIGQKSNKKYLFLSCLMIVIGWICISRDASLPFLGSNNGRGYICFFIGVILSESLKLYNLNYKTLSYIGLVINIILMVMSKAYGVDGVLGNFQMVFILFTIPTIILASLYISWFGRLLSIKLFTLLGKLSLSIYLTHLFVLHLVSFMNFKFHFLLNYDSILTFILILAFVLFFAILWNCFVEKKLTYVINKWCEGHILTHNNSEEF